MAIYEKVNGVWTQPDRVYVTTYPGPYYIPVTAAYGRNGGNWTQAWEYDVLPPNPPELDLSVHENWDAGTLQTRYIKVGVRLPGTANDPDARLVRVLTDYNGAAPTTQFGGTYTSASDADFPTEPWSEWRYNSYGPHPDTSVTVYKQWPRNATYGTKIAGDKTYHFGAWSLDNAGNWSVGNWSGIHVPKAGVDAPNVIVKEARFQPNGSGSWRTDGYHSGDLIQQASPHSAGLWFHGNQITDSVGASTGSITIKSAEIYIQRENDGGSANANLYLYWHPYVSENYLPSPGSSITKNERVLLGTIAKGQGKWFNVPQAYYADMNTGIKGFGLDYKDPVKASAFPEDYSDITSVATNLRSGEVHVVWTEAW